MGTRPEIIKLAPVILAATQDPALSVTTCLTNQHPDLSGSIIDFFKLKINHTLSQCLSQQPSLSHLSSRIAMQLDPIIATVKPDCVVIQGDTASAYAGALTGFYNHSMIAHVEAGLRSYSTWDPFPEEMHRRLISQLATMHFAPTATAVTNLQQSGITQHVTQVGNTGIDALNIALKTRQSIQLDHKPIIVTCHRRENWGKSITQLCRIITQLAHANPHCQLHVINHANPDLSQCIHDQLNHVTGVTIHAPLAYPDMIQYIAQAHFIITDSGGIQEEATCLGKPVLVFRQTTERQESITYGNSQLVCPDTLYDAATQLLTDTKYYASMATARYLYGDGHASERIIRYVKTVLSKR